ncbi:response regulator transcription factor [Streptomyces sp. NBC_00878]|uniref:response regulator transcription factor n=1 Tax=Streptomyces sp. NBC_00878 TaxID=2975854 RepID=UPI0022546FE9|nr:response regulator transcription factor [Streptomyces sp. NBC_00878]MCX4907345.1 response regulator transcription factor [Streptomyces sp. NBC_00878]
MTPRADDPATSGTSAPAHRIRLLVVDDDPLVRAGLRLMLSAAEDIDVVAEAADGADVQALVDEYRPDLVLMDIRMPKTDGLAATAALRQRQRPRPPEVLILTTFTTDSYVLQALRAGAAGYILKHTPPAQIVAAVRNVMAGEPVLSSAAVRQLIDTVTDPAGVPGPSRHEERKKAEAMLDRLGAREREVALAVAEGRTNAEIAAARHMSLPTVKAHVSHILTRLGLNNRVQIALLVYRAGHV